ACGAAPATVTAPDLRRREHSASQAMGGVMVRGKSMMIAVAGLVIGIAQPARADVPSRIQFARGKSSALVKGSTGDYGVTYVIRANGGQVLMLDLSPRAGVGIKVSVEGSGGLAVLLKEEH